MRNALNFYIDGHWVSPLSKEVADVVNPATEEAFAQIAMGNAADVDRAVAAARRAFESYAWTSRHERLQLLRAVLDSYRKRERDIAGALSLELGVPLSFSIDWQAAIGRWHFEATISALERYTFEALRGSTMVSKEPIGVVGLITPWNWPMNQIVCKVAPALAAGCTMVLKPSEITPLSVLLFTEALEEAGVPPGVFNLVNGDGATVGQAIAAHPDVDMVSFTGSTAAGIKVAKLAADTVKRVSQELGGKSANIILRDADLEVAVRTGTAACFSNSGQSCNAPTRMLVPVDLHDRAADIARQVAESTIVGDPFGKGVDLGPVVSDLQYSRIQAMIQAGIDEGATLVAGGPARPSGLNKGYYVRPTVFADVRPGMRVAREEIFGPVLAILPYESEDEAVAIANDTVYGLASYVQSPDLKRARRIASRLRSGQVQINYPQWDRMAPFGGYKQSGNGREYADFGIDDFVETKGIVGYGAA